MRCTKVFALLAAEAQIIKSEGHQPSQPGYRFQQRGCIKASVVTLATKLSRLQGAQKVKPAVLTSSEWLELNIQN
jgi:hypothetical protein